MAGGATFHPKLLVDGKRPFDLYPPASEMIPRIMFSYLKQPIVPTIFAVVFWPVYKALAKHFRQRRWSEAQFFTLLFCSMITGCYALFNATFALIEHKRWLERYKMDRKPHQLGSWKLVLATLREAILGRLISAPLGIYYIGTEVLKRRGLLQKAFDKNRPSLLQFYFNFMIGTMFNDVAFYWAHRTLHCSALYGKIHKQHHEWKGTVSYAAEFARPVEQILANYIPTFGGCLLVGAHPWTVCVWVCQRLRDTYEAHSGYAIKVHPVLDGLITNYKGAAEHDFHHTCNSGNCGPQWMDWLCGTMDAWAVAAGCDGHLQPTTAEKLSYMHPAEK